MRWTPRTIVSVKSTAEEEDRLLATAIAIGEKADRKAIDRAIRMRKAHRALKYALKLMAVGKISEARRVLEIQLEAMDYDDERRV